MNTIGALVKQKREAKNLTQTGLANATGRRIAQSKIAMLESGEQENLRISTLLALADGLGCAAVDLLPEEFKRPRQAQPNSPFSDVNKH